MTKYCRAYLTPPWWVTMGYAPRHEFQAEPPAAFQPPDVPQPHLEPPPLNEQPFSPPPVNEQPTSDQPPPISQQPSSDQPPSVSEQPASDQPPPVSEQPTTDQPPPVGQQPPAQAPPLTGEVLVIAGTVGPDGAETTVEAHRQADDARVSTTTTDDMGNFSLPVPTNGTPFDGYLTLTKSGQVPTRVYVSRALTRSATSGTIQIGWVTLVSWQTLTSIYQTIGQQAQATQATLMVSVRDSAFATVQPEGVAILQGGNLVGYLFDPSSLGMAGVILALNVPSGVTQVVVESVRTMLGPVQITAPPGQMIFVVLFADQT